MAKSNKWNDPYDKYRATNKLAEFYGVQGYGPGSRGGGRSGPPGLYSDSGRDTSVRRNDIESVRRGINDAMASGSTSAYLMYSGQDLPHANDIGGMYDIHKEMEEKHSKTSGGAFNNLSDVHGLAQAEFDMNRSNLADEILEDVMDQVPNPVEDKDDDDDDAGDDNNGGSLEDAYNTGNLSPSFMDALNTRTARTSAQTAAQALLASTVRDIAEKDDEDGLLNSDKYLIDYSQPYNGLSV